MLTQSLEVYARLVIITVDKTYGIELDEIFVARIVFGNKHEVVELPLYVSAFDGQVVRHIKLAADNGLYSLFLCQTIKVIGAVHIPVVGYGYGGHVFSLQASNSVSIRVAPSKRLYSVCRCKCTNGFSDIFYLLYK